MSMEAGVGLVTCTYNFTGANVFTTRVRKSVGPDIAHKVPKQQPRVFVHVRRATTPVYNLVLSEGPCLEAMVIAPRKQTVTHGRRGNIKTA